MSSIDIKFIRTGQPCEFTPQGGGGGTFSGGGGFQGIDVQKKQCGDPCALSKQLADCVADPCAKRVSHLVCGGVDVPLTGSAFNCSAVGCVGVASTLEGCDPDPMNFMVCSIRSVYTCSG